jgi:hypothetical protein
VGVGAIFLKFSPRRALFWRTFTRGAALAFDLALASLQASKSLVFRARFSFEFFQCPVFAHAFPNCDDRDVA